MANLGNAWHLPGNPEPRGNAGMRDPVFPTDPVPTVTVFSGNQFQGGGNPGNQLQDGSAVLCKQATDTAWQTVPLIFATAVDNNKYYSAAIPTGAFPTGTVVQYYLRIAYDDHDTTFLHAAADMTSIATGDETAAQSSPFTFTIETPDKRGQWGPPRTLRNVGIHAHVLPNGLVLMWGRRDNPQQSLDTDPASPLGPGLPPAPAATCTPFLWNPANGDLTPTPQPTLADGQTNANLFCSGHAFLPDGRLLVAGGHLADSHGLNQATIYDPVANTWTPTAAMIEGRWYPTAITLPSGSILVLSGSFFDPTQTPSVANNVVPQVWSTGTFTSIAQIPDGAFDLYPRMHVASTGIVYMTSLVQTWSLDVSGGGTWNAPANVTRHNGLCDYAPSVMYDVDKVLFVGGGNPPTANAETIDLSQAQLAWQATGPMNFARRQHNATILPDGTVLVTGGTRGGGDPGTAEAFNDLDPGQPVHIAELWDPKTGQWTELAAENTDRCYHSTAVLLPDGRVLSAGSGEFILNEGTPQQAANDPQDSHTDAQVFSPPYLFKGPQPEITSAPDSLNYGDTFEIGTAQPQEIATISLIRLSSVTHSFNANQRIHFLVPQVDGGNLTVTAPPNANVCPPGHYMLFILNSQGVPSVAKIVQISAPAAPATQAVEAAQPEALATSAPTSAREAPKDAFALRAMVRDAARGTLLVVGIRGTCPYGIAACWGGANEALRSLEGVQYVDPIPDGDSSTATVYLEDDRLPALDHWHDQFRRMVRQTYVLRGVEVTLKGIIEALDGVLMLADEGRRPPVELAPLEPGGKVQWDSAAGRPRAAEPGETAAYDTLTGSSGAADARRLMVTGPLHQTSAGYRLQVRLVEF
ncbi:MAG TPA: galactose oxidase-like domain-containing protein [Streptosporangiaceae bacterium]|nr:galactose oxidase-like domain-containing protein [Streptosporangiaceae bacterium]